MDGFRMDLALNMVFPNISDLKHGVVPGRIECFCDFAFCYPCTGHWQNSSLQLIDRVANHAPWYPGGQTYVDVRDVVPFIPYFDKQKYRPAMDIKWKEYEV